ncbi:DUF2851 family protein, partial [Bacteroidales bacterium OttesenSCG-928-B11]|nr:DUF2851 family protein [Bacteroidales bacterium OttesenSCG-928-B11]
YQSVILHVVYEHDADIYYNNAETIPVLELKPFIPQNLLEEYQRLTLSNNELPCKSQLPDIPLLQFTSFLSSLSMERLLRKQEVILKKLRSCQENWDEVFFRNLAVAFGFKTNTAAFEELAKSIPFRYIQKHEQAKKQIEALLFGQAGMLDKPCNDDYFQVLLQEYQFLKYKYGLTGIKEESWNYLRLRPKNFPALRIAQFADLLYKKGDIFKVCIENIDLDFLKSLLACKADNYWAKHHKFGVEIAKQSVALGEQAIQLLIINAVVPTLFAYGTFQGNEELQMAAVTILERMEFEENKITKFYRSSGFPCRGALFSQAILELRNMYCAKKRCLHCGIGKYLLKGNLAVGGG